MPLTRPCIHKSGSMSGSPAKAAGFSLRKRGVDHGAAGIEILPVSSRKKWPRALPGPIHFIDASKSLLLVSLRRIGAGGIVMVMVTATAAGARASVCAATLRP
jgi:hypothetical protein